jgi:hypothetical protein
VPDQLARSAGAEDRVTLARVGQQLDQVLREEGPVGLGQHDQVPRGLGEPAPDRVPVALLGLEHLARRGLLDLLACAGLGVVVDDEHLVDHARPQEALDHATDRVALGVGHQDHGDCLVAPHQRARRTLPRGAAL